MFDKGCTKRIYSVHLANTHTNLYSMQRPCACCVQKRPPVPCLQARIQAAHEYAQEQAAAQSGCPYGSHTYAARLAGSATCSSIVLSVLLCWSSRMLSMDELNLQGEGQGRRASISLHPKNGWLNTQLVLTIEQTLLIKSCLFNC